MQIGRAGLGRMGANMARRLIRKSHSCVVFNRSPQAVNELVKEKAIGATSVAETTLRFIARYVVKHRCEPCIPDPYREVLPIRMKTYSVRD